MNYRKGFFRIWIILSILWMIVIIMNDFPKEAFKTLRILGVRSRVYIKADEFAWIKCTQYRDSINAEKLYDYAAGLDIQRDELDKAVLQKDCNGIGYLSVNDALKKPRTKELINEINNRIKNSKSEISNFFFVLFLIPLGSIFFVLIARWIFAGFRDRKI